MKPAPLSSISEGGGKRRGCSVMGVIYVLTIYATRSASGVVWVFKRAGFIRFQRAYTGQVCKPVVK
jgi:hypothetical protein